MKTELATEEIIEAVVRYLRDEYDLNTITAVDLRYSDLDKGFTATVECEPLIVEDEMSE